MFHRLIYQKKAVYSQTDVDSFSTKDYTCVKLMRTKKGKPVGQRKPEMACAEEFRGRQALEWNAPRLPLPKRRLRHRAG